MQSNIIPTHSTSSPIQSTSHLISTKPITLSIPTQSNLSQNDEGCFVEPPFPSPMSNNLNRRTFSFTSTNGESLSNSIIPTSSRYPIQRLIRFETNRPNPTKQKKIDFLSELPIELSLYIILKINQVSEMIKCRQVSKNWKSVSEDSVIWYELFKLHSNWKVKKQYQIKSNSINPSNSIKAEEKEKDMTSIRRGSEDKLVARRFSQLIGIEHLSKPNLSKVEEEDQEEGLDWFKVFKDRFIIESNWKSGKQNTRILKGHQDSIYCLKVDQNKIITGSRDRSVKVWDLKTGSCKHTLNGHQGSVLCLRFSGDRFLLSGSSDCKIIEWDYQTGEKVCELIGHRSGVLDLTINEEHIISCSKDQTIKIWNRSKKTLLRTLISHTGPVNAIEGSKDGSLLVSASGDSTMKLWNPINGELLRTFEGHLRGLACIKLIEELGLVITGSNDQTCKVWDLKNGQCLKTLLGHEGLVRTLDVDVNQRRLVTGSYDKTIKVWDFETGLMKLDFRKSHKSIIFDVSIDLHQIISVGHDSNITILDFADGIDCENFI